MSAKDVVALPSYGIALTWVDGAGGPSPTQLRRSRWQDRAACTNQDTEAWFVRNEGSRSAEPAKQVCATCPVQRDCLAASLVFGEEYGVWGGLDRHQRHNLTQRLRRGATLGAVLDQALGDQALGGRSSGMDAA